MPELPDIELYLHALRPRIVGRAINRVHIVSPFVLRTFDPDITSVEGRTIEHVDRIGKRIVVGMEDDLFLVIHLMIAGRLQWRLGNALARQGPITLAAFAIGEDALVMTEAAKKKRASLHVLSRSADLREHTPDGIDVRMCTLDVFRSQLHARNRTLKRALTDPSTFDGIGNAYSDEILHRAQLSPLQLTQRMTEEQVAVLHAAARDVLLEWTERLIRQAGDAFPTRVTAFRPEMAVHGKFGQPCPVCGTPVARIVRAENEVNYCPKCQTNGKVLKDRSLSRLLRDDWPSHVDDT